MSIRARTIGISILLGVMAASYSLLAMSFVVGTLLVLWKIGSDLLSKGVTVPDMGMSMLILLVAGGATLVFGAFARGFWFREPWVPGTVTVFHTLWGIGALIRLWDSEAVSLWLFVVNGIIICFCMLPAVRKQFQ